MNKEVQIVLGKATIKDSILTLSPDKLDRKVYMDVDKVLKILGGKWNRKQGGHVFDYDPTDKINEYIDTGYVEDTKKVYGFFETSPELAQRLVDMVQFEECDLVLEPSAGKGAIAEVILNYINAGDLHLIDIQESNCKLLRDQGYLYVYNMDFLDYNALTFDKIIMNPPFAKSADVDHVTHAYSLLNPGGVLVSVMSAGTKFRSDKKTVLFRKLVDSVDGYIEDLPEKSFKGSGTNVNTVIVYMEKV